MGFKKLIVVDKRFVFAMTNYSKGKLIVAHYAFNGHMLARNADIVDDEVAIEMPPHCEG